MVRVLEPTEDRAMLAAFRYNLENVHVLSAYGWKQGRVEVHPQRVLAIGS